MMPQYKKELVAIPIPEKKGEAFPFGQDMGVATEKVTGTTTQSAKTMKKIINFPSGEFNEGDITVKELLATLADIIAQEGEEVLDYTLIWTDKHSNAFPVRFEPMGGRIENGIFCLEDPATVLCVN